MANRVQSATKISNSPKKDKPTFKIVEESNTFDYDAFAKDYMDTSISKKEMMEKYDLSNGQYYNRVKMVKKETGYSRQLRNPDMKYIVMVRNKYRITYKQRYYGIYPDLKTAQMVRDILVEHDWSDKMVMECIKLYSNSKLPRGSNQYNGSPIKREALERFDEFRKLYESNKYTGREIQKIMGFTEHQYRVCREKMKHINPVRKPLVRDYWQ